MVEIIAIPNHLLDEVWEDAEPFIIRALEKGGGEMSIKDVYNWIQDDKYILLAAMDESMIGAVILEIQDYPQKKRIGIPFVGGENMKIWFSAMWEAIREIAKSNGADSIIGEGRDGWARYMKDHLITTYTVVELSIWE